MMIICLVLFQIVNISGKKTRKTTKRDSRPRRKPSRKRESKPTHRSPVSSLDEETDSEEDDSPNGYHQVCIQVMFIHEIFGVKCV